MSVEEQLAQLNSSIAKLLAITQLEYNFDQTRYLAQKVRAGEAVVNKGSGFAVIAPGATFSFTLRNPAGYVWIVHFLSIRASQDGVFEVIITTDGGLLPYLYMPRGVEGDINLNQTVPYDLVVKETATFTYINHDTLPQWGASTWIATYLRKDVWERDIGLINAAAKFYGMTSMPAPPLPPPTGG